MITNQHYIEIYVQGNLLELESQDSLNLRINNVLFNPTKTSTSQAEYSYSFKIPSTPNNDRLFGYANTLSKINKFHNRYKTDVYADGTLLFEGSLTIRKYEAEDKEYECNLVNIKVNTLDDIFGESVMTNAKWEVDFDGADTINTVNANTNTDYFFPLVSYGVFQKKYVSKDAVGATYTSKFVLDKYNEWWIDCFYPSMNMVETLRKLFEWKGYTVNGSVFSDPYLNSIYMSCNLADEQVPSYNLGNPKLGKLSLYASFNNEGKNGYEQDLEFPYYYCQNQNRDINGGQGYYNFSTIDWWNMLYSGNSYVSLTNQSYMYDPNEQVIVIPQSGWYKIDMSVSMTLHNAGEAMSVRQWYNEFYNSGGIREIDMELYRGLNEITPIEVQLIRNYDDNIELIKGRLNRRYLDGHPYHETVTYQGGSYTGNTVANLNQWETEFPHEELYGSISPTVTSGIVTTTSSSRRGGSFGASTSTTSGNVGSGTRSTSGNRSGTFGTGGRNYGGSGSYYSSQNTYGYMHKDGSVMPYDVAVSPSFICGFSSHLGNTVSIIKDGYSWSKMSADRNMVFANVDGLNFVGKSGDTTTISATTYCKNSYRNSPTNSCNVIDNKYLNGQVHCCVWLEKDDRLSPVVIQRHYNMNRGTYAYTCEGTLYLDIEAISERNYAVIKSDSTFGYNSPTEFPTKLNLFNFTNKEKKISEWIKNIQTAFNLDIIQDGDSIDINTNQGINKNILNVVDIDDRVSNDEVKVEVISYPKEMSVKYKIDTDEWGFEKTVPSTHIDDDDWKEWGDSGYTVIQLSDDTYETSTQNKQTDFSYTYYDDFTWKEVLADGTEDSGSTDVTIRIPVIEKSEFMIDGYNYEDAMTHDGYGQAQRFWYRQSPSTQYVWTTDNMHSKIWLTYTTNSWNGFNLSYKDTEKSLATEYFNIYPMLSSNYVKVDVYLTPQEYTDIKNGALIHFDSDLYYISEISSYDPSGNNKTTLKMIKKV